MSLKDLFKNFFKDEEVEETLVDPIVEQRRKEKFSAPLIYNDEIEETEEKAVEKKPSKSVNQVKRPKVEQSYTYSMTEIISPMMGKKETVKPATQPAAKKVKKKKAVDFKDQLVPVISPFYGNTAVEEEFVEQLEEKKKLLKQLHIIQMSQNQ